MQILMINFASSPHLAKKIMSGNAGKTSRRWRHHLSPSTKQLARCRQFCLSSLGHALKCATPPTMNKKIVLNFCLKKDKTCNIFHQNKCSLSLINFFHFELLSKLWETFAFQVNLPFWRDYFWVCWVNSSAVIRQS